MAGYLPNYFGLQAPMTGGVLGPGQLRTAGARPWATTGRDSPQQAPAIGGGFTGGGGAPPWATTGRDNLFLGLGLNSPQQAAMTGTLQGIASDLNGPQQPMTGTAAPWQPMTGTAVPGGGRPVNGSGTPPWLTTGRGNLFPGMDGTAAPWQPMTGTAAPWQSRMDGARLQQPSGGNGYFPSNDYWRYLQ